jgi:hypothetical protein
VADHNLAKHVAEVGCHRKVAPLETLVQR